MVCSSLPNFSSSTSPTVKSSELVRASACSTVLRPFISGAASRRMVNASFGCEPLAILWVYEVRTTAVGEPLPYPTLPCTAIVPEEKIDFSTANPVFISDVLPNPPEGEPATNDSVPFRSRLLCSEFAAVTAVPSGSMRRIGRLALERSTHFQSSSSPGPRIGPIWMASNSVFSVTFTTTLAPARRATRSRNAGKNEGALTFKL